MFVPSGKMKVAVRGTKKRDGWLRGTVVGSVVQWYSGRLRGTVVQWSARDLKIAGSILAHVRFLVRRLVLPHSGRLSNYLDYKYNNDHIDGRI